MATHRSILAWKIPWTKKPGGLQSLGSQKSQTQLSARVRAHTHTHHRMNRNSPDILGKGQTCANPLKPEGNDESWKSGKKMDMAGPQDLGF